MALTNSSVLLVTANVGSIFEDPDKMLKIWLDEFLTTIKKLDPDFLAVHCQEVGGKNYEESMQYVNEFIKALLASDELAEYDKARVFLDEDYTAVDKFTALGNLYFIHESVTNVQIWDFKEGSFVPILGREVLSGSIENVSIKEKAKFPQDFFPDCKWSRKGFLRTRWNLNNSLFDLVNIHLFHDASNFAAMETSPSLYVSSRHRAFQYTLDRLENDELENVPMMIFGDFNFRLDTHLLVKKITRQTISHQTKGKKDELSKVVYTEQNNGKTVLTLEKKLFDYHEKHPAFSSNDGKWLREFDREINNFKDRVEEYEVNFPPSYPFSEDVGDGISYMKTRCPAWCDRILLTQDFKDLIASTCEPEYRPIGQTTCMGDHKPIYLKFEMVHKTATSPVTVGASPHVPSTQVKITEVNTTKYIHVRQNGAAVRVFRETSV